MEHFTAEDFKEGEFEKEEKKTSWIKKLCILILALFLILLILSYVLAGSDIVSILGGKFASYEVGKDLSIRMDDGKLIIFDEKTYAELVSVWDENRKAEFKVCLSGTKEGYVYYIKKIMYPLIFKQTVFSVTSEPCPKETLISLHSHPDNRCLYSLQDSRAHREAAKSNPDLLSAVMCSKVRFGFYQ